MGGGWSACRCCSIAIPVHFCSPLQLTSVSNGTTVAAEPANDPAVITQKIETKRGGKKSRAPRRKPLPHVQICLPAGDASRLYVCRSACASRASVWISKLWFAAFKMQNDPFQNVFIKHETHIFFSAYKDAIKLVLLS